MPKSSSRARRLGEQIQRELAELIRLRLKDPRMGMVTVTAVVVSGDGSHAKVYVSSLRSPASLASSLAVLQHSAGFLRHELGQLIPIRTLPQLHFLPDLSLDRGIALSSLIDSAVAADSALQQAAADRAPTAGADDPPGEAGQQS